MNTDLMISLIKSMETYNVYLYDISDDGVLIACVVRDNRSDEQIDMLMRELKLSIYMRMVMSCLPITFQVCKVKYKIVEDITGVEECIANSEFFKTLTTDD